MVPHYKHQDQPIYEHEKLIAELYQPQLAGPNSPLRPGNGMPNPGLQITEAEQL
jgi:hypothetical protein